MKKGQQAHNFIDRTGMRFGKLVCQEYLGNNKWKCLCDCGNEHIVDGGHLPVNSKKRGIKSCGCGQKSKTCPNQNYFDVIDTSEKAYIIGLLASDGSIYDKNNSYYAKIRLNYKDVDILEKIQNCMNINSKITYQEEEVTFPQGGKTIAKMCCLNIYGKQIIKKIEDYGLIPNKTLHLKVCYEQISEEFIRDYLRGLWDGDGCFGIYDRENGSRIYEVGYIGSYELLNDIKDIIHKYFPSHKVDIWHAKECNENIYRLGLSRRDDFIEFLNFIYKDSSIYLNRKYQKYLDCMDKINNIKYKKSPCRNSKTQSTIPNGGEIPQQE